MKYELWHDKKIAIVTGGARGIGLAIAQALKQRGALVAIGGRNPNEHKLLQDSGFLVGPLDVIDTESVEAFVSLVTDNYSAPDILVNCAGISVLQNVCGHSDDDWNDVIDTNLNGPFKMIRSCLPQMMDSGWGRIVNIAVLCVEVRFIGTHKSCCTRGCKSWGHLYIGQSNLGGNGNAKK